MKRDVRRENENPSNNARVREREKERDAKTGKTLGVIETGSFTLC